MLDNEVTLSPKLSVLCICVNEILWCSLKPPVVYSNNVASLYCLKPLAFWKPFSSEIGNAFT